MENDINEAALNALAIFKAGVEWQKEQTPWISVKKELPTDDENKFVTNYLSGALSVAFYDDGTWFAAYTGDEIIGISHWMHIPVCK